MGAAQSVKKCDEKTGKKFEEHKNIGFVKDVKVLYEFAQEYLTTPEKAEEKSVKKFLVKWLEGYLKDLADDVQFAKMPCKVKLKQAQMMELKKDKKNCICDSMEVLLLEIESTGKDKDKKYIAYVMQDGKLFYFKEDIEIKKMTPGCST